jgi:oligopeptide/dipeptide ABC transporter ATP-binding protein
MQAVFQDPWSSLNPQRRIFDLIAEPLRGQGQGFSKDEIAARVFESLESVGLSRDQSRLYPHEFSGGQRQRIAIAAALSCDPKIVVLDEPVSALDVSVGAQILNLFRDLQDERELAFLFISHGLSATRFMAHDIGVMYLGKLVEQGPADLVFQTPMHPYTRTLLSAELPNHPSVHQSEMVLRGEVPSPIDPPNGCVFHPRCPWAQQERCSTEEPEARTLGVSAAMRSCPWAVM